MGNDIISIQMDVIYDKRVGQLSHLRNSLCKDITDNTNNVQNTEQKKLYLGIIGFNKKLKKQYMLNII